MIVTKKSLPRRTFLRGAGTLLALPLLDAMIPSLTALADTPASPARLRRLGFVYMTISSIRSRRKTFTDCRPTSIRSPSGITRTTSRRPIRR